MYYPGQENVRQVLSITHISSVFFFFFLVPKSFEILTRNFKELGKFRLYGDFQCSIILRRIGGGLSQLETVLRVSWCSRLGSWHL